MPTPPALNITGGQDFHLPTRLSDKVGRLLRSSLKRNDVGVLVGAPGLGKTHVIRAEARLLNVPVLEVTVPKQAPQKEVLVRLLSQLTGVVKNRERYLLAMELEEHLAGQQRLVVVDEAQFLARSVFDLLSTIHGRPESDFALIYVGGRKVLNLLESYPHLESRVGRVVDVGRPSIDELIPYIRQLRPTFATAPHDQLVRMNVEFADGRWRSWIKLAHALDDLQQVAPGATYIDESVADAVLEVATDGVEALL